MARVTRATQVDLSFGDSPCELLHFGVGVIPAIWRATTRLYRSKPADSNHAERRFGERLRPCLVFGPVLARAFARFALTLRSLAAFKRLCLP